MHIPRIFRAVTILALVVPGSFTFGHGEEKPGPHGGVIRMPGGFHTEVSMKGKTAFEVHLLDADWKNPTIKGSQVSARIQRGKTTLALTCEPKSISYHCALPTGQRPKKGDLLVIEANREGMPGAPAEYTYPLSLSASAKSHHDH